MIKKKNNMLLYIMMIFVMLQPVLDILSTLANEGYIINISTYIKPIFVFGMSIYMLFKNPKRIKWFVYFILFIVYIFIHLFLIYSLSVPMDIILHEFRFVINILYMFFLYQFFDSLIHHLHDKYYSFKVIKSTLLFTVLGYLLFYIVSVISDTSYLTYSFSDMSKFGYRGWYYSGQIFGHTLSILFPILLYTILKPNRNVLFRIIFLASYILVMSLIGTKVSYYITFIVLILYLVICLVIKIFNKEFKRNWINISLVSASILCMFLTFEHTPTYKNNLINDKVLSTDVSEYDLDTIINDDIDVFYDKNDLLNNFELREYIDNVKKTNLYLEDKLLVKEVHPADNRKKQFIYNSKLYDLSSFKYKLFGIGYLNQLNSSLVIEGDFFMALFNFGILGFILFLLLPLKEFIKTIIFIFKNIKKCDLELYMLFMGVGIFFSISIVVGCTYIYTNFSIFLVLLLVMLRLKKETLLFTNILNNNKISFLLLHLGYGGIESSTINTANALIDKYDIEIMSFYKLSNNQSSKLDDRIKVKYLYDGGPNKDEFIDALRNHDILKLIEEGIKSINILIKKKTKVIKYIINSDSRYIVSTRYDFSMLLSKYGSSSSVKIAQEHHYHNNDKKYINVLKYKYNNIDYLFALTKTLEEDYKIFLKNNNHTKVVLVPNMLYDIPKLDSNLKEKNLVTVSRLDHGKRIDEIVRIFSKIEDKSWKLCVIGDGDEYNNLKELVTNLNLDDRVILTGYKNKNEIEEYLLKSSIFLMASVTEGLPMVLLEAMSYGLPCIAYETASGTGDIIKDGINGYIITNRNENDYVDKLNILIGNVNKRKEFGQNAKETVFEFSKEKVFDIWNKILK